MKTRNGNGFLELLCVILLAAVIGSGCAAARATVESGMAYIEQPSMELVLDRINTASAAAYVATTALNHVPISDEAEWPEKLEAFPDKEFLSVMRALAFDGAYVANGGIISPIKGHVVMAQQILYDIPPDMYSAAGTFYKKGEPTIINGYYYKVYSDREFDKKENPNGQEIKEAVAAVTKNIFVSNKKGTVSKRQGLIKSFDTIESNQYTYPSVMDAVFEIIPEVDGHSLKGAYDDYLTAREQYMEACDSLADLKKAKSNLNNAKAAGEKKVAGRIDEQLNIESMRAKELEQEMDEKKLIFDNLFSKINEQEIVLDEEKLKTLRKVREVCKGVEGLLAESMTLAVIALAKLPDSISGVSEEIKRLTDVQSAGAKAVWLPLRLTRLKTNVCDIGDNIKMIAKVLKNDTTLVIDIHKALGPIVDRQIAADATPEKS